ncbi:MAG: glycoside hydrolase family 25 protein [Chitinophagaceae bacterium]|nr:glycoside hydrolase family 25 protein [Chitinophagaceae bacterium]
MAKKKKKKLDWVWWVTIPIITITLVCVGYVWYTSFKVKESSFVRYPAFGIDMPVNFEIHGIDVSKHQGYIHWPSVKNMYVDNIKLGFVFIKATEGLGNIDKQFKFNWNNAGKAQLPRGAYHFFLATKSGKAQAKNFISTVTLKPGDLPPVLDIEQLYRVRPDKMRKEVKDWLQAVEEHYGVKPIIYTYVTFYTNYLKNDFDEYPLWVAHYLEKEKPRINRPWIIWQHNEAGRVNGIKTRVDFNVFNGDSVAFKELLMK